MTGTGTRRGHGLAIAHDFGILDISTLSPGTTVLTADWGAPYLRPGTHELLIMTVRSPDGTVSSPIALITAG
jgi:hypothetical protein